MSCSIENFIGHIPQIMGCFIILGLFDKFIFSRQSRWFKLHVVANTITCIFSYRDFATLLIDPLLDTRQLPSSTIPANMTLSLHLYHMLLFEHLHYVDWLHHIVMITVLGIGYYCQNLALINYGIFVVNGLPGGIDYFLLVLVGNGTINRMTEKRINSKLGIWIRSPGILIGAYIIYLQSLYGPLSYPWYWVCLVVSGLYWNAQYFTERVVYNWGHNSETSTPTVC